MSDDESDGRSGGGSSVGGGFSPADSPEGGDSPVGRTSILSKKTASSGYTYWKREIPDAHLLPSSEPKRIASGESSDTGSNVRKAGPSPWNASGTTWEEKNCWVAVKERLTNVLTSATIHVGEGNDSIAITSVKECEGEATMCYVRGKGRLGYDFKIEATFAGTIHGAEVDGTIEAEEVVDHATAFAVRVTCGDVDTRSVAMRGFVSCLTSAMKKIEAELS